MAKPLRRIDLDLKLQQTMVDMFLLWSVDVAYNKISGMLFTFGDLFSRIPTERKKKTNQSIENKSSTWLIITSLKNSTKLKLRKDAASREMQ
ncbi:hypothetical protein Syun_017316 [Stephania yunnanensis]|uniref:Uncharacterized protein n=1 Tax=Stephania yunnanensis TaxID=152371 RepID=A0AAP0J6P7_9MAGN